MTPTPGEASLWTSTSAARDGAERLVRRWRPEGPVRAHVALAHGYAEHGGRYARFAGELAANGFFVHALDHRGHGGSPGVRGDIEREHILTDLAAFAAEIPTPRFLFGHSLGGALAALASTSLQDLAGLVLSSPYLVNAVPVPAAVERGARLLARGFPYLPVQRLDPAGMSRLPEEVRRYVDDPLVYTGRVRARAGIAMLALGAAALAAAPRVTVPTLVFHGTADRIADPSGSRAFAASAGHADVRLELVPGGFHELLSDTDREHVTREIVRWLEHHVAG